jgi:hypothetical protein
MQGHPVRVTMAFVILLGFVGCSKQPTIHIRVNRPEEGGGPEAHHSFKAGTVLQWTSDTGAFHIQFEGGKDPCVPSTGTPPNSYGSTTSAPFTAECTVTSTPVGSGPFRYDIISGATAAPIAAPLTTPVAPAGPGGVSPTAAVPAPPSPPPARLGSHCEGCVVEIDGQ